MLFLHILDKLVHYYLTFPIFGETCTPTLSKRQGFSFLSHGHERERTEQQPTGN